MLRLKTWQYVAVASEEAFISAAIVDLGYAGLAFATAYDRQTGEEASFERLVPFARGFQVAPDLASGASTYVRGHERLRFANDPRRFTIHLPEFQADVEVDAGSPWQASWPIGSKGKNETLKDMGSSCLGRLTLRERRRSLDGFAMVDWTRGKPARKTQWRWACGTAKAGGQVLAWNLRTGFDDPEQVENALWVAGMPRHAGPVRIEPGSDGAPWRIVTDELDLRFEPHGMRREDRNLLLVASRYQQPWGRYHGTFLGQPLEGYGVVEDHWALW